MAPDAPPRTAAPATSARTRILDTAYELFSHYGLRAVGIERLIEESGGKLVGVWVTLGRYDVVEVFEAPDDETALEIVTKLGAGGGEDTETLRAFTREEAEEIIRKL